MTLIEFLTARLDEDEAAARAAIAHGEGSLDWADEGDPTDAHIARHDPAYVLADVEAKRRIVKMFLADQAIVDDAAPGSRPMVVASAVTLEVVLRLLALPFADHPDYDEAWRP